MKIKRKCSKCGNSFKVDFILIESDWDKIDLKRKCCPTCIEKMEFMMRPEEVEKWDKETREKLHIYD